MRLIIIANRSPVNIQKKDGSYLYTDSPGGLASGLKAFVEKTRQDQQANMEFVWVGWPGIAIEQDDQELIKKEALDKFGVYCVFLSEELMDKFYLGFCNKTIWPLFHYFPAYAIYEKDFWEQYIAVNKIYCSALLEVYREGDVIWVHDYHLMLLPGMIRKALPNASVGFFLHIPFPSYEIFRLMPSAWRRDLLRNLYGADLIGFHTYDYRTHFLQSTQRILGLSNNMGEVTIGNRLVKVDSFPMGIDYQKYYEAAGSRRINSEKRKLRKTLDTRRLILSIDRQDYSKGILNRLIGYELFLEKYPEWKEKVVMMIVVVPSRIGVEHYQLTKSQIDELVGRINGRFGNMHWTPALYQYRSLGFDELVAMYSLSDVALITPLRDGMNLIAKEYIATRSKKKGTLILSEMAGSADELAEAIIINPNNMDEIADSLNTALVMKEDEQSKRIGAMQKRLITYDVFKWADDFLSSLRSIKTKQDQLQARILHDSDAKAMIEAARKSAEQLLFIDYDGTLVPFSDVPERATPPQEVLNLLEILSAVDSAQVILVSGREKETLEKWFGHLPINIVAEHGIFLKEPQMEWQWIKPVTKAWKKQIRPVLEMFARKLPAAFVEEKEYSLAFHYRKADPQLADLRLKELMDYLISFTANMDVQLLNGNKVLEVKNAGIDKGVAALHWLSKKKYDFILAIGDDQTDEDLFRVMPPEAYSIKVGLYPTYARFSLNDQKDAIHLLNVLAAALNSFAKASITV